MTINRTHIAMALSAVLLLGACAPVSEYTDAEAFNHLTLDSATTQVKVRFAPGSAALSAVDAAQLRRLAATGAMGPRDRIVVAAAGSPALAEQRVGAVSAVLLHYGIVVETGQLAQVAPDHALIEVTRTLVTLPPCPNWSKRSASDFANAPSSNFGCSTESDLGLMVANPSDLASGRPMNGTAGQPAAAAVNRYMNDKVVLPTANTALPVATATSSTPTAGGSP
jgi:pilus assembly protein CpaD